MEVSDFMTIELLKNKRIPYICTPLTGISREEIREELAAIIPKQPDIIEWRADFLEELHDTAHVLTIADEISTASKKPLLFTIRSEKEGGEEIALSEEERVNLLHEVCENAAVDIIDFEVSNNQKHIELLRNISKKNNKKLILSYHNFDRTPANPEILKHLFKAEFHKADIAKVAVMPNDKEDVLRLLEVTKEADVALDIPIVTMSMGEIGGLSRMMGWAYGSVITFGVGMQSSAPGQISIDKLKKVIAMSQEVVGEWK